MAKQYGIWYDLERCIGCHACSVACKIENNVDEGIVWHKVKTIGGKHMDTPSGAYPNLKMRWEPTLCMHCKDAPCMQACPAGAITRRNDGIVVLDPDVCYGLECKECTYACPYGVIEINEKEGVMEKCNLCSHRIDQGLQPACVDACVYEATFFGDLNDPDSVISKKLKEKGGEVLLPERGTDPAVYYWEK
ncbi:MAG: 4Fe-4S dicluster domain-containing protein [Syntrophales bacterium]|nr:4Fe-4S dicluster domain-containing protein [Syntrophales bacterium]